MKLIRNIEKNTILELKNEIQVKEGSVVSQNLARNSGFELSLYSFGGKESISEQVSSETPFTMCLAEPRSLRWEKRR